ncbi:Hypothetical protein BN69_1659 [Methylocystis sp. SC2]|nr:Hypothetical protein BN69_1659 [Methylocystis sp. SC2]
MRRFREHRGSLDEALETTFAFKTIAGLEAHIRRLGAHNHEPIVTIAVEFYGRPGGSGDDARIGWKNVHLVYVNGVPFGWMEGPWTDAWTPCVDVAGRQDMA